MLSRAKDNVLKLGRGVWDTVSKKCVNNGLLDAGHLIPEFAFRVPGLWREREHGFLIKNKL